jgi:hypothetical protein
MKTKIESDLLHATGTENYYKHFARKGVYTDGVKYLAEAAQAYWLIDIVMSYQLNAVVRNEGFQTWELRKKETSPELFKGKDSKYSAVVKMHDGNNNYIISQYIVYTDFILDSIDFYFIDGVLLLPSEY